MVVEFEQHPWSDNKIDPYDDPWLAQFLAEPDMEVAVEDFPTGTAIDTTRLRTIYILDYGIKPRDKLLITESDEEIPGDGDSTHHASGERQEGDEEDVPMGDSSETRSQQHHSTFTLALRPALAELDTLQPEVSQSVVSRFLAGATLTANPAYNLTRLGIPGPAQIRHVPIDDWSRPVAPRKPRPRVLEPLRPVYEEHYIDNDESNPRYTRAFDGHDAIFYGIDLENTNVLHDWEIPQGSKHLADRLICALDLLDRYSGHGPADEYEEGDYDIIDGVDYTVILMISYTAILMDILILRRGKSIFGSTGLRRIRRARH